MPAACNPALLVATALLAQSPHTGFLPNAGIRGTADLRAGLDTLYAGAFEAAARYFAARAARDTMDAAPLVFEAGAYIWWGEAQEDETFERAGIDSLLDLAIRRARWAQDTFWLATAYGYRARQRELSGSALGAAKDAKRMRDGYRTVLAGDSNCADCYLGLGLYEYGLARVGAVARFVARLVGLGSGDAGEGIRYLRRAALDGDLAQVEATWVLAAALVREATRDRAGRAVLEREARAYVLRLLERYPENPVFQRFLQDVPEPAP